MRLPVAGFGYEGVEKQGRKENRGRSPVYCQLVSLVATVVAAAPLSASGLQPFICLFAQKYSLGAFCHFKEPLLITETPSPLQMSSFSTIPGHVLVFARARVPD